MKGSTITLLFALMVVAVTLPVLHAAEARYRTPDTDRYQHREEQRSERSATRTAEQQPAAVVPTTNKPTTINSTVVEVADTTPPVVTTAVEPAPAPVTPTQPQTDAPEPHIIPTEPTPEPVPESPIPFDTYVIRVQTELHRLTNLERTAAGVAPLTFDENLAAVATAHSEDMAQRNYFSHTSPGGCDVGCRLRQANYVALAWGENIAWISASTLPDAETLAAEFMENWMDSSGHRHNILSDNFTHEGIGVARTGDTVYATDNFTRPRK